MKSVLFRLFNSEFSRRRLIIMILSCGLLADALGRESKASNSFILVAYRIKLM